MGTVYPGVGLVGVAQRHCRNAHDSGKTCAALREDGAGLDRQE